MQTGEALDIIRQIEAQFRAFERITAFVQGISEMELREAELKQRVMELTAQADAAEARAKDAGARCVAVLQDTSARVERARTEAEQAIAASKRDAALASSHAADTARLQIAEFAEKTAAAEARALAAISAADQAEKRVAAAQAALEQVRAKFA